MSLFFDRFKPPSVVISFLFSGTKQIKFGLFFNAIAKISLFNDISRFVKIFLFLQILTTSLSFICLLSSLKCMVTESAPHFITYLAANKGSG